jgi:hypothetical protein
VSTCNRLDLQTLGSKINYVRTMINSVGHTKGNLWCSVFLGSWGARYSLVAVLLWTNERPLQSATLGSIGYKLQCYKLRCVAIDEILTYSKLKVYSQVEVRLKDGSFLL